MTAARHLASLFHREAREAKKVRLYRTASPADLYPHSITDTTATHNIIHCNSATFVVVLVVVVVIFLFILLVLALQCIGCWYCNVCIVALIICESCFFGWLC